MINAVRSLARLSSRRPWITLALWATLAVGLTASSTLWGRDYSDVVSVPGSDSATANDLLAGSSEGAGSALLMAAPTALTEPDAATVLQQTLSDVGSALGVTLTNPLDNPAVAAASGSLSQDGTAVNVAVPVDIATVTSAQEDAAREALHPAIDAGWDAAFSGDLARALDKGPGHQSEVIGIAAAIIVLSIGLGSLAAMAVPVVTGLVAVVSGLGMLGLLSRATSVPEIAPTLATMIGLGVGIDYALFQVTRLRQALASGATVDQAVLVTAASAGTAATFAGTTVAISICALAISGVTYIGWLGYASAIIVAVVVVSTLTFTPAFLTVLGRRLDTSERASARAGARTGRAAEAVTRHPWVSGGAALVLLALLAIPAASLHLGMTGPGDRPVGTEARTSFDLKAAHFGDGSNATLAVVVQLDSPATRADDSRLAALDTAIKASGAASATPLTPGASDPAIASARVTPTGDQNADSTAQLVKDLRAIATPDGTSLHVGGATATRLDLADRVTERLPWLMLTVVTASTLLLVVAFRSLVIPIKAAVLNLVSVAASYGVVVAVFQWGWGAGLIGLDGPVAIDSFVPMILFTVLFGLSTDYEVFLVSSMRETWSTTRDARTAIVHGMRNSGRVIITAAIIMISVFLSFVMQDDPTIKIFGLGLATSILIDATIIRMLLVPAIMSVLEDRAWYLPAWLDRILPHVDLHGGDEASASEPALTAGARP